MPTFTHSKNSVFKIQDASGTLTDVSAYTVKGALKQAGDAPETTAFGASAKTYIGGLTDGTFSIDFMWDGSVGAIDELLSGILAMARNFEYHPAGTTTGNPKYAGTAILKSFEIDSDVSDVVKGSAEFQLSGLPVRSLN